MGVKLTLSERDKSEAGEGALIVLTRVFLQEYDFDPLNFQLLPGGKKKQLNMLKIKTVLDV